MNFKCVRRFCDVHQLCSPPMSSKLEDRKISQEKWSDVVAERKKFHVG